MKIVATIGPNSNKKEVIEKIIEAGVDGIRLNFSHFNEKEFAVVMNFIQDKEVKFIADLCGAKVRVYEGISRSMKIYTNEVVYFCSMDDYEIISKKKGRTCKIIPLNISSHIFRSNDIKEISMKDNTMQFEVIKKDKYLLEARVKNEGIVRRGKGCNIPNLHRGIARLTEKDKSNIVWAINHGADFICQSYVENKEEVLEIRDFINSKADKKKQIQILAKIETPNGVEAIEEIAAVADGIVIGRGDLTAECGLEDAVIRQNKIVKTLRNINYDKTVIIATHLFDNMIRGEKALYSEVECIFNFIDKGISALMLTGETSIGRKPVEVVRYLNELIKLYHL